jgi:uncharacterized membrane protein HdeD (DUF308 family)
MAVASSTPGAGSAALQVWRPFLARASVSAVFGLITVFVREPSTQVMSLVGGAYLLLVGAVYLWTHRLGHWERSLRLPTGVGAGLLLGAGIVSLVSGSTQGFAIAGAVALVVAGIAELVRGLGSRTHPAGRDLVTVGVIGTATGAALPFVQSLGAHALLGVTGGGALLTAVVLGIAALSHRHDSALSASTIPGSPQEPDPVN